MLPCPTQEHNWSGHILYIIPPLTREVGQMSLGFTEASQTLPSKNWDIKGGGGEECGQDRASLSIKILGLPTPQSTLGMGESSRQATAVTTEFRLSRTPVVLGAFSCLSL